MPEARTRHGRGYTALVGGFVGTFAVTGLVLALAARSVLPLLVFLVVGGAAALGAWLFSADLCLKLTAAAPADERVHARLDNLTDGLCGAVGVSKPTLYVIDDPSANAYACGRDERHASVVVTSGLLDRLNRVQLEGVLARELNRIKTGEIGRKTLLVGLIGVPAAMSDYGLRYFAGMTGGARSGGRSLAAGLSLVCVPLGPVAAAVLRAMIGHDDDGLADLEGVEVTRYPPGLFAALLAIAEAGTVVASAGRATAHLWVAAPLSPPPAGDTFTAKRIAALDTHGSLTERIDTLGEL